MFIKDLEFIDSWTQEYQSNGLNIRGGVTAIAGVSTTTTDGEVSASAFAAGSGGASSRAQTQTGATIINRGASGFNPGYTAGYATAYGAAYGADPGEGFAIAVVSDTIT